MTKAKHTPGPWQVVETGTERLVIDQRLVRAKGAIVMGKYAYKLTIDGIADEGEFLANIFLIAAAPEMLNLIERASYWFEAAHAKFGSNHSIDFEGCAKEYRTSLANATGQAA